MSIGDKKYIDVLNYNNNVVAVGGLDGKGYCLTPAKFGKPAVQPLTLDEISYINSRCNAFKDGVLRFRGEDEAELYEYLGIKEDDLLLNEWIEDALENPTADKLNRILNISDSSQFERVRGCYYSLVNSGEDLSVKVGRLVDARYIELRNGKIHTALSVMRPEDVEKVPGMDELKQKVDEQTRQIEKYQAMVEKLLANAMQKTPSEMPEQEAVKTETVQKSTRGAKKKATNSSNAI